MDSGNTERVIIRCVDSTDTELAKLEAEYELLVGEQMADAVLKDFEE